MTITHLYGSLSKNITDIIKGGGCPDIKDPMKRYNVLKYFSRQRCDFLPAIGGVVGDGGMADTFAHYGEPVEVSPTTVKYKYTLRNINLNTPDLELDTNYVPPPYEPFNFQGGGRFLNISNFREVTSNTIQYLYPTVISEPFNSTYSDTIKIEDDDNAIVCHIVNDNEVRAKTGDYYEYNLLKTNHTMDITPAGTETPVSKTADLMEFVFLHVDIPPCKEGDLYIELEDTDITGSTTNDWLVYFYYWESNRNENNISNHLDNGSGLMSDNADLRYLDNDNEPVGVARISRLAGQVDNKFVLWLNRFKAKGERFSVNILIGLNPEELRNDYTHIVNETFGAVSNVDVPYQNTKNETPTDLVLKFSKASVKIKKRVSFDSLVRPFPCWGYTLLDATHDTLAYESYAVTMRMYSVDSNYNTVAYGSPSFVGFSLPDYGTSTSYTRATSYYRIHRSNVFFYSGKNYILRLPNFVSYVRAQFNWRSDNLIVKIYAGPEIDTAAGSAVARMRTFYQALTLIDTIPFADLAGFVNYSAYPNKTVYKYKYVTFDGSLLESFSQTSETHFYISLEESAYQISDATVSLETAMNDYTVGIGQILVDDNVQQYYLSGLPRNLGVSLFPEETFILKTEEAEQINYFS